MITQRSLSFVVDSSGLRQLPFRPGVVYWWLGLRFPRCMTLYLDELSCISHVSVQLNALSMSVWRDNVSSSILVGFIALTILVSSAKRYVLLVRWSVRSLI